MEDVTLGFECIVACVIEDLRFNKYVVNRLPARMVSPIYKISCNSRHHAKILVKSPKKVSCAFRIAVADDLISCALWWSDSGGVFERHLIETISNPQIVLKIVEKIQKRCDSACFKDRVRRLH